MFEVGAGWGDKNAAQVYLWWPPGFIACMWKKDELEMSFSTVETKWNWTILCGLSSLSCADSYLFRRCNRGATIEGEDSSLPGLLFWPRRFLSMKNGRKHEDFFLVFHGQTQQMEKHTHTHITHTGLKAPIQTDTYMLSAGHPEQFSLWRIILIF